MSDKPTNAPFFVDREVIVLNDNGIWIADGTEISHEPTRRLFARSLFHDEQGYILRIGRETKRIEVEDTAYFIRAIEGSRAKSFTLQINDETPGDAKTALDPATLQYRPGRLTCRIERHGRQEEAKFLHAAYHELLGQAEEDAKSYFISISGKRIDLAERR